MTDTLINALVKAQKQIDHIVQDAKNPFFKSDYATLKAVFDSVKQPLNDNDIYIQQVSHPCDDGVIVETVFYGHGGSLTSGQVHIPAAKTDPQAYGSALSYAKRYSLLMACGIATKSEDDDAEKAMRRTTTEKAAAVEKPAKYKLIASATNKAPVATANDEVELLDKCRGLMKKPDSKPAQELYEANKDVLYSAMEQSEGDTKDGFSKMIQLFESND